MGAMKAVNPNAVWVVQAWGACPYPAMIKHLNNGDMLVLDLYSENRPQWGDPESTWYRKEGFNGHDWAFCMLLNFGGNVGMFGKLQHVCLYTKGCRTDNGGHRKQPYNVRIGK